MRLINAPLASENDELMFLKPETKKYKGLVDTTFIFTVYPSNHSIFWWSNNFSHELIFDAVGNQTVTLADLED